MSESKAEQLKQPDPKPGEAPKPEDLQAKAARLAEGNPLEYEHAVANATPTEKAAFEKARAEFEQRGKKLTLHGTPGGAFSLDGVGFGSTPGSVVVNGTVVPHTRWSDTTIRGTLPANVTPGDVVVQHSDGHKLTGSYGKR